MPARITVTNDQAEMMYVGETPWHGLGTHLDAPSTAEEAIVAAHMDWTVITQPVYTERDKAFVSIENKLAVIREDTGKVFGVFSDRYTPMQNVDAFKFFDTVVGAGEAVYHTAGSFNGGSQVWILARMPEKFDVANDTFEKYILLNNSHDGTKALTMILTGVRVVCWNTNQYALGENKKRNGAEFYARHTPHVMNRANTAQNVLGLSKVYFHNLMLGLERLASKEFARGDLEVLVR